MIRNFGYILITTGTLMFGIGIVNNTLISTAKATHPTHLSEHEGKDHHGEKGEGQKPERKGMEDGRERGGTYEMGERGEIREEGKEREQKAGKEGAREGERSRERERERGGY